MDEERGEREKNWLDKALLLLLPLSIRRRGSTHCYSKEEEGGVHTTCYILRKHTLKSGRGLGMKEEGSMSVYCEGESIVLCVPFSLSLTSPFLSLLPRVLVCLPQLWCGGGGGGGERGENSTNCPLGSDSPSPSVLHRMGGKGPEVEFSPLRGESYFHTNQEWEGNSLCHFFLLVSPPNKS